MVHSTQHEIGDVLQLQFFGHVVEDKCNLRQNILWIKFKP
jgi:hypothetical protein